MGTLSLITELALAAFAVAIAVGVPLSGIVIEHRDARRADALRAAHRSISASRDADAVSELTAV